VSDYSITISKATRHGRRNLHTFVFEDGNWWAWNPPSRGQIDEWRRETVAAGRAARFDEELVVFGQIDEQPTRPHRTTSDRALKDYEKSVKLADGVNAEGPTLAVILDALHSDRRPSVDIDDIKTVLSELGSQIKRLDTLPDEQRQHATPALYTEILRRCTTL
jgi:hypothetical protein